MVACREVDALPDRLHMFYLSNDQDAAIVNRINDVGDTAVQCDTLVASRKARRSQCSATL